MAAATTTQVVMPQMGDSVTEGTILEWRKSEGDRVNADETLVEISTDKVDAEVPAPISGTVVKIHAPAGQTVAVGAVLAEIAPNGGGAAVSESADAPEPPTIVDIVTPAAGESVTEGTILEWTVAVGDVVSAGDTVVEISTDKVDVELPAPAAGTIIELLAAPGETVTVGQVIGRISSSGTANQAAAPAAVTPAQTNGASAPPANGAKASPVARRAAETLSVDLGSVAGSGPAGRILQADVLAAAEQPGADGGPRARRPRCAAARRCSPATWTRAVRCRRRRASARSS